MFPEDPFTVSREGQDLLNRLENAFFDPRIKEVKSIINTWAEILNEDDSAEARRDAIDDMVEQLGALGRDGFGSAIVTGEVMLIDEENGTVHSVLDCNNTPAGVIGGGIHKNEKGKYVPYWSLAIQRPSEDDNLDDDEDIDAVRVIANMHTVDVRFTKMSSKHAVAWLESFASDILEDVEVYLLNDTDDFTRLGRISIDLSRFNEDPEMLISAQRAIEEYIDTNALYDRALPYIVKLKGSAITSEGVEVDMQGIKRFTYIEELFVDNDFDRYGRPLGAAIVYARILPISNNPEQAESISMVVPVRNMELVQSIRPFIN